MDQTTANPISDAGEMGNAGECPTPSPVLSPFAQNRASARADRVFTNALVFAAFLGLQTLLLYLLSLPFAAWYYGGISYESTSTGVVTTHTGNQTNISEEITSSGVMAPMRLRYFLGSSPGGTVGPRNGFGSTDPGLISFYRPIFWTCKELPVAGYAVGLFYQICFNDSLIYVHNTSMHCTDIIACGFDANEPPVASPAEPAAAVPHAPSAETSGPAPASALAPSESSSPQIK